MLLHDKPESSDIRFGHQVISDWLAKQIESVQPPFRLAITGGLGTGKSTILQAALASIEKEKKDSLAIAYVDVWKLDKDSVRRSALVRIAKDLLKDSTHDEKLRESLYGSFSEASYIRPFRKVMDKTGIVISLALFAGLFVIAYMVLSSLPGTTAEPWWWKALVSIFVAIFNLASRFLEKAFVHVQRTFNRAPMVGAEEFEEGLQKILDSPKLSNKRVVVLFDNIDRAAPDSSRAILAGISAFFDHSSHARLRKVLIIVPFDPSCLKLSSAGDRSIIDDCDKMFDAIVPLPKLTIEDLSDFAFDHLKKALDSFKYSEEVLRDLAYLVSFSPYRSPREIKHMVNQLYGRLDLANSLETGTDPRLLSSSTLLPKGSVTYHPDALLKLLICEKIFAEFTEIVVNNGVDLRKAFEPAEESVVLKSELMNEPTKKSLVNFLQATTGIPKEPPQSAAAFLYLKGPDQVISIPSGQLMSEALYMNDPEKLKEAVQRMDGAHTSQEDIAAVVRYHRKKYTKNVQALKNAIRSIFSGLGEVQKFEKSLVIELCELLALVPDMLAEISPSIIAKYTNDYLEVSAVQKVWRIVDSEFKVLTDPAKLNDEAVVKWASEYFDAVYKQSDGLRRSGLDVEKLPYRLLLTDSVSENLGEDYPSSYCSPENILESVKRYLGRLDEENANRYEKIVSNTFGTCTDFDGSEKMYQEISNAWQGLASQWMSGTDLGTGDVLSSVIYFWPSRSSKSKPYFEQIKSWVVTKVGSFHQKASAGYSMDVLDICLAFYSQGVTEDGNIDNIIQHVLGVITREQLEQLRGRYVQTEQMWSPLNLRASGNLIKAIDRTQSYDFILADKFWDVLKAVVSSFEGLQNKAVLLDELYLAKTLPEEAKAIFKNFKSVQGNSRTTFLKLMVKLGDGQDALKTAMDNFILNPDDSNAALFDQCKSMDVGMKKTLSETAINALVSSPAKWTEKEARIFFWVTLAPEEFTDVRLKDPIEIALERGAQNGVNETVQALSTEVILKLWEQKHGFSEKSYKILKKTASKHFAGKIALVGEINEVQETFAEMFVDKLLN